MFSYLLAALFMPSEESRARRRQQPLLHVELLEDRLVPSASPTASFAITQDWGTGYQAQVVIANPADHAAVTNWQLGFDYSGQIGNIWDAAIISHVGNHYVVGSAGWNSTIATGGKASFGFLGSGNSAAQPTGYVLDGIPLGGTTPAPAPPPAPPPPPVPTPTPTSSNIEFKNTTDWGTGFTGQITIKNPTATPIKDWTLTFTFAGQITSVWNGQIVSHTGNEYVIKGASWNSTIAGNSSVSFGFNGTPGNLTPAQAPASYVLRGNGGAVIGGSTGGGTTNAAPTALADTAFTVKNQPVTIAVLVNDTDPDHDSLSLTSVGAAQHGSVVKNADGTLTYTPATGYLGSDSFSYTVSDGQGHTAPGTVNVTVSAPAVGTTWPQSFFAPYVDATAWPTYDFVAAARTQGIKYFTLAFIVAGPSKEPSWGGYQAYDVIGSDFSNTMKSNINTLRGLGGDVMVSFGGAANQELAQVITTMPALTSAYQSVIDAYGLTHIDFDIEGAAVADRTSIDRRSQAIAALQQSAAAAGKELSVTFTLPVLPTGLTADGLYLLQSAKKYGVTIAGVNIMAMDYGDSAAPNPSGQMGSYAIASVNSLFTQLQGIYGTQKTDAQLWHMIGITPMIGVNDVVTEVFTPQDAQQLLAFARQKGIGELSMWSLNRDQPGGSGISQQAFDFSKIFNPFTG